MKKLIKNPYLISVLFLIIIAAWSVYDSENYFNSLAPYEQSYAATLGQATSTLRATVGPSLTLSLDSATVSLGTINAGTPAQAYNALKVDTNNATGYYITAGRNNSVNNDTMFSAYGSITIDDSGLPVHNTTCTADTLDIWVSGASTGLGFSLFSSQGSGRSATCWGGGYTYNNATNKYGAFAASASATTILSQPNNTPATQWSSVAYILDVSGSQTATTYNDGSVIYTATVQ